MEIEVWPLCVSLLLVINSVAIAVSFIRLPYSRKDVNQFMKKIGLIYE